MPQYSFNVYGVNRVRNQLRGLVSAHSKLLDPAVRQWAQSTRGKLKGTPYPAPPNDSKYVRTGNLANRFAVSRIGTAKYRIQNNASYGSWVVGEDSGTLRQAQVHKGRWWQMQPIIEKELPELRMIIEDKLSSL